MVKKKYFRGQMFCLQYEVKEAHIDFEIKSIDGIADGDFLTLKEKYELEKEPSVKGYLKWDGCMNWTADAHFCGSYGFKNLYKIMEKLYEIKSKQWPHGD